MEPEKEVKKIDTPQDPPTQLLERGRNPFISTQCADGVTRNCYEPKYKASRNCYDCWYYGGYGFPREEATEMCGLCFFLSKQTPQRIKVEDMKKACENFRLLAWTKEYNQHVHGTENDFCRNWNRGR